MNLRSHDPSDLRRGAERILLVAACLLAAACQPEVDQGPAPMAWESKPHKTMLMHYMPWYETPEVRGMWGSHWMGHAGEHDPDKTGPDGMPDIYSHYHPLIGLYDSSDPAVLECQLLEMKLAGVNGVIVDWYGIGEAADYPPMHVATKAMFEAAGRLGMNFAVCYEDRTVEQMIREGKLAPEAVPDHLRDTVLWLEREWFSKPHYFRVGGRPLMLNFGPIFVKDPEDWKRAFDAAADRPAFYPLHHLWKKSGGDGGFSWVHWEPWNGGPDEARIKKRLNGTFAAMTVTPEQLIVSAFPGFNDVYVERHRELDHRDGKTLTESLAVCMEGPWPLIQLVTWNDYGEGTMIEPTHEFGYTFLEIIQAARKRELGDVFPFTPDDLRLPARLLEQRRKAKVPPAELDRIARLLSGGNCAAARAALDKL